MRFREIAVGVLAGVVLAWQPAATAQPDTSFTYQGSLSEGGMPASGAYNIDFTLWDAISGGGQIGPSVMLNAHPVTEGRLSADLDFGDGVFDGASLWLEISVNGTELSPRQRLTRTPYAIASDSTRGLSVDSSGNVSVGTPSDPAALSVQGALVSGGASGGLAQLRNPNNQSASFSMGWLDDVARLRIGGNGAGASGGLDIQRTGDHSLLRVLHNGNVGIGTASPIAPLEIAGPYQEEVGQLMFRTSPSEATYGWMGTGSGHMVIGVNNLGFAGGIAFQTGTGANSSEHMRIAYSGRVGIGTSTPAVKLHVVEPGSINTGIQVEAGGHGVYSVSGVYGSGIYGETISTAAAGVQGVSYAGDTGYGVSGYCRNANGYDFYARGPGINYGAPSSIRWKRNITPVTDPLGKLAQIRGVYYDWDEDHGGNHDIGFIGEEVGRIVPEIVAYDTDGEYVTGMDYGRMTPLLVEAVNALRAEKDAEIAAKNAEITELNQRLLALERFVHAHTVPQTQDTQP